MRLVTTPRFDKSFRKLTAIEQDEVRVVLGQLLQSFGNPHRHAGIGIRKLIKNKYECRAGLRLRVLFSVEANDIFLRLVGDHNEIRNWLKNE